MKISPTIVVFAVGVVAVAIIAGLAGGAMTRNFSSNASSISYADFIAVMLTGISLLMALLAVFLAVLGVIGWNAIVTEARARAEKFLADEFKAESDFSKRLECRAEEVAGEYLRNHFKDGRPLSELVKRHVEEQMANSFVGVADEKFERDARGEQEEE